MNKFLFILMLGLGTVGFMTACEDKKEEVDSGQADSGDAADSSDAADSGDASDSGDAADSGDASDSGGSDAESSD